MDRKVERAAARMMRGRGIGSVEAAHALGTSARRVERIWNEHQQGQHQRKPH